MRTKVFTYVTVRDDPINYLLVFDRHEEPGYEVPKGSVEPGEKIEDAVQREVFEESGLSDLIIIKELGVTVWHAEEQHFFFVKLNSANISDYDHQVTGDGPDEGFRYRHRWLDIEPGLKERLVQGCIKCFDQLLLAVE